MAGTETDDGGEEGEAGRRPLAITGSRPVDEGGAGEECPRHGEMTEMLPLIRRAPTGHLHAARDGYWLWSCAECCIETRRALPFEPPPGVSPFMDDPDEAVMWVLFVLVESRWDAFADAFVDLGPGEMVGEAAAVGFEHSGGARFEMEMDDSGDGEGDGEVEARWRGADDIDIESEPSPAAPAGAGAGEGDAGERKGEPRVVRLDDPPARAEIPAWLGDDERFRIEGPDGPLAAGDGTGES